MRYICTVALCLLAGIASYGQTKKPVTKKPPVKTPEVKVPPAPPKEQPPAYSIPSRIFVKTDSTYKRWQMLDTGYLEYPWHIGIDAQGRIVALLKDAAHEKRMVILDGGKWKPFQEGMPDTPSRVIMDGVGGVYVPTRRNLYKLTPQGWQKLECATVSITGLPAGGRDGKLYAIKQKTSDFAKGAEIVVWKDGCWAPAGPGGAPLMTPGLDYTNFVVDKNGHVYCWNYISYGTTSYHQDIHFWNGDKWKQIAQPDIKIYDNGIDSKDRFFAYGFGENGSKKARFFGFWDGSTWGDAPYPPETNKEHGVTICTNNAGTMFVEAYPAKSGEFDHRLFALEGDLYVRKAEEDKEFSRDFNMLPLAGEVYAIDNKTHFLNKYNGSWNVKKTTFTTIPVAVDVTKDHSVDYALERYFLFEENGKKGIKDKDGKTLVEALFDEIVITRLPASPPAYEGVQTEPIYKDSIAICLRSGADKTYINAWMKYAGASSLRGLWRTPKMTCGVCKGVGHGKDQTRQVEVKGDWVEGKTHTTTKSNYERVWNSRTNSYEGVTTKRTETNTDPGYRKPSTYKTEVIPGAKCTACNGEGSTTKEEVYRYQYGRYVASWE